MQVGLIKEKICKCFHLLALCDCSINRGFSYASGWTLWAAYSAVKVVCCLPVKSRKLKGWPLMPTLFMTSETWTARHKMAALTTVFKTSKCRLLVKLNHEPIEKLLCLFFNPLLLIGPIVRVRLGPPWKTVAFILIQYCLVLVKNCSLFCQVMSCFQHVNRHHIVHPRDAALLYNLCDFTSWHCMTITISVSFEDNISTFCSMHEAEFVVSSGKWSLFFYW